MEIDRHKVFISYYHADDQRYKEKLSGFTYYNQYKRQYECIFEDCSVRDGDIDDNLSAEQIRRIIRDEFIKDATVFILLCGENTKHRKHVDWEIHAAMFDTEKNPKMGIIVINLPTINQNIRVSEESEKPLISDDKNWFSLKTRDEFEKGYPYMPSRIIDNFVKGASITVVPWNVIENSPEKLMILIDNAFCRRKEVEYDHSTPLRRNNS